MTIEKITTDSGQEVYQVIVDDPDSRWAYENIDWLEKTK